MTTIPGIESFFPNTLVNWVKSYTWETLLNRIGDGFMFHLLLDTILFFPLENSCYAQITGTLISDGIISMTSFHKKPKKNKKEKMLVEGEDPVKWKEVKTQPEDPSEKKPRLSSWRRRKMKREAAKRNENPGAKDSNQPKPSTNLSSEKKDKKTNQPSTKEEKKGHVLLPRSSMFYSSTYSKSIRGLEIF
jgi:hypothetical protein